MTVSPMPQKLRPALWHHTDSLRWQICRSHCGDRFDRPQCDGVGDFRGAGFLAATTLVGFGRECVEMTLLALTVRWLMWHRMLVFWHRRTAVDDMTILLRPAAFWESAEEAIMIQATRPWVIAYCDLDDFKQVNDHYGHAVEDTILRTWGQIFREEALGADIIDRLGGEEVGWWMPSGGRIKRCIKPRRKEKDE